MDPRERYSDPAELLRMAMASRQARLWTSFPGIIESFDALAMTAVIQPALQGINSDQHGNTKFVTMPLLVDCPVQFPGGGAMYLTHPLVPGDEVLVVIASRCIDSWWQNGGVQPLLDIRMHDLSDGFCVPGVFSQPNVLPNFNMAGIELRNRQGTTKITLNGSNEIVSIIAPGGVNITGTVTVVGDVVANGVSLQRHIHSGVTSGNSDTSPPVAGT